MAVAEVAAARNCSSFMSDFASGCAASPSRDFRCWRCGGSPISGDGALAAAVHNGAGAGAGGGDTAIGDAVLAGWAPAAAADSAACAAAVAAAAAAPEWERECGCAPERGRERERE